MNGTTTDTLTVPQKILVAASSLPEVFHESDLVEAAWLADKPTFGMRTKHDAYPDLNKVRTYLVGAKGLERRGWFFKCGQLRYKLTTAGREEAERIKGGDTDRPLRRVQVPDGMVRTLEAALSSPCLSLFRQGPMRQPHVLAAQARHFIDSATAVFEYRGELVTAPQLAEGCLVNGETTLTTGRTVTAADLAAVRACLEWCGSPERPWNRGKRA